MCEESNFQNTNNSIDEIQNSSTDDKQTNYEIRLQSNLYDEPNIQNANNSIDDTQSLNSDKQINNEIICQSDMFGESRIQNTNNSIEEKKNFNSNMQIEKEIRLQSDMCEETNIQSTNNSIDEIQSLNSVKQINNEIRDQSDMSDESSIQNTNNSIDEIQNPITDNKQIRNIHEINQNNSEKVKMPDDVNILKVCKLKLLNTDISVESSLQVKEENKCIDSKNSTIAAEAKMDNNIKPTNIIKDNTIKNNNSSKAKKHKVNFRNFFYEYRNL
jgi:hypothetical protein